VTGTESADYCDHFGVDEDEPKIIVFLNPIHPEAPGIDAEAEIAMLASADGGLKQSLHLPSPSLVFRVPDSDPVLGYTTVIEAPEGVDRLNAGSAIQARVKFVGVPEAEVWRGRTFALWHGRDVGTAKVIKVVRE
jgi:hypothetical protein